MQSREENIVHFFLDNNEKGFPMIVDYYKNYCYQLSLRIVKNTYDAEEVVQDSFLKLYSKISTFRQDASLKTWLYKIVVSQSLNKLKAKKENITLDDFENAVPVQDNNEEKTDEQNIEAFSKALNSLNVEYRTVLYMFYRLDCSLHEISVATEWSESKIKTLMHRGRKKIKEILT